MKFVTILLKGLKETVRDKRGLAMLLLFPLVFMVVFGYAFGAGSGGNTPHDIVVLNEDEGTTRSYLGEVERTNFGENFTRILTDLKYENSSTHMFIIHNQTREEALDSLMKREIGVIVTIPPHFSKSMEALINFTVREEVAKGIGQSIIESVDNRTTRSYLGEVERTNFGENFTRILTDLKNANNSTYMLIINNQTGVLVTIPANVSKSMGALINFTIGDEVVSGIGVDGGLEQMSLPVVSNINSTVEIEGDPSYMEFGISQSVIQAVLMRYETEVRQRVVEDVKLYFPEQGGLESRLGGEQFLAISIVSVSGTEQFTAFDFQAPGIMIFALLLLAVSSASVLARESEKQTLSRLKLSLMSPFDLLLGTLIRWAIIALAQVAILFGTAVLIGFHWTGGFSSIIVASLVGVIAGIASVALGLILASFAKSESHASNMGTLVAVPLSFLMGAFFPIEAEGLIQIMPWGQAVIALRSLLSFGNPISDVIVNIEYMIVQTIVLFSIGVFLFSRSRFKAE